MAFVVILTIALSIAARSVTNLRITAQTEQSQRAFAAAEAGIEESLRVLAQNGTPPLSLTVGTGQASINYIQVKSYELYLPKDEVVQINPKPTNSPTADVKINIFWGDKANPNENLGSPAGVASLLISCIGGDLASSYCSSSPPSVFPEEFGCNGQSRPNNFGCPPGPFASVSDLSFEEGKKLTITDPGQRGLILRIRTVYNGAKIKIECNQVVGGTCPDHFPPQVEVIESRGEAAGGQVVRKIKVTKSFPTAPAIFDYVLFSGGDITK